MTIPLDVRIHPYLVEHVQEYYQEDTGDVVAPVASSTYQKAAVKVTLSRPQVSRVVEFHLVRMGKVPVLPPACVPQANEVLIRRMITPMARKEDANGTPLFAVAGTYVFRRLDGTFPVEIPASLTFPSPSSEGPLEVPAKGA